MILNKGDKVKIRISRTLISMGLSQLNNRTGVVSEVLLGNRTPGAMVKLDEKFDDCRFWFVPAVSLITEFTKTNDSKKRLLSAKVY